MSMQNFWWVKEVHYGIVQVVNDSYRIVPIYKQTNKQVQLNIYTSETGYMYMDLPFLVYFPLSNLKLYLILVFVMFFYCSNALSSGHPGGLTQGNPRTFAPRHLEIPPTQGQYSSTKSEHCPFPGEHNLKGPPNCNVVSCIIFNKSFTINI